MAGTGPNALLVAMATGPVDEEALVAGGDAAWELAERSQHSAMWMTLLIVVLMVPALALQEPKLIVLGNLFRDQLDRYGEMETLAGGWARTVAGRAARSRFALNADDPLIADLGRDAEGRRRDWHFGELIARSAGLSGAFAARGVGRGDVVMTLVGNRIEWVLSLLACWRMGAVALPCNTQLRRHDLEVRVAAAAPRLCVGEEALLAELPNGVEAMTVAEVGAALEVAGEGVVLIRDDREQRHGEHRQVVQGHTGHRGAGRGAHQPSTRRQFFMKAQSTALGSLMVL